MTQEQLDKAIENRREREEAYHRYRYTEMALSGFETGRETNNAIEEFHETFHVERDDIIKFMKEVCRKAKEKYMRLDKEFQRL